MKTSLIATILNEEENILVFLESLLTQTTKPQEVIIVDGGSSDQTINHIQKFIKEHKFSFRFSISTKKGNRSVGRNEAIRQAKGDIILISDPGCILDKEWVREILKPFQHTDTDVVAGYYESKAETTFQKCLVPYVLVMPDRVNPNNFLPATRSMGIRKYVWKEMGGFDESYSHNEDYVFARKLKKMNKKIVFARKAIVYWIPRKNIHDAFIMFKRFAYGDMEAGIIRPKVIVVFLRYLLVALLLGIFVINHENFIWYIMGIGFTLYIFWSISKNYRYVKDWHALYFLPILQFTSDIAVLQGSWNGLVSRKLPRRHKEAI
jgi:glycosyltransferase involved in cell wall biosynthesis